MKNGPIKSHVAKNGSFPCFSIKKKKKKNKERIYIKNKYEKLKETQKLRTNGRKD
jgi:hypothetical protein